MYIADLHIHSKYSRATGKECDLPHLDYWAGRKGIGLVGTGDFTHPAWRALLRESLVPAEQGLYTLKESLRLPGSCKAPPRFLLSAEISCIYKRDGRVRKVHSVILLPSLEAADKLSARLEAIGNVHSDGRPILGLDSRDLLEITLTCCKDAIFVPAHIWTPHFSLLGAFSGFDSVEECFRDLTPRVRALETGLSSDPPMNRRVSRLDGFTLISNSDAHSPQKLGREANIIDAPLSYPALKSALETGEGFYGTLEFYPEEGKYHLDGHRACGLRLTPDKTRQYGGVCPVCGKRITVGVLSRVEQLADRPEDYVHPSAKPFEHLLPLRETIASSLGVSAGGKKALELYEKLLNRLGSEFFILREAAVSDIRAAGGERLAEGIARLRRGEVNCLGGYDGEYGTVSLFSPGELQKLDGQICFLSSVQTVTPSPQEPDFRKQIKAVQAPAGRAPKPDMPATEKAENGADEQNDNEARLAAVHSESRVCAVVAGPGAGKTRTLIERIACLVKEKAVPPENITAVTFTNQAAAELKQRLSKRLSAAETQRINAGTFHSLCLKLLKERGDCSIADRHALKEAAEKAIGLLDLKEKPEAFLRKISAHKNGRPSGLPPEALDEYCKALKERGALDFDDLIARALELNYAGETRFTHLLVDEFQDVNPLQYRLIKIWRKGQGTLFVIGDPDQAIYSFRGAAADGFNKLTEDFSEAEVIRLSRNYRCTYAITAAGLSLISHNPGRRQLTAVKRGGSAVRWITAPSPKAEAIFAAREISRMTGGLDMLSAARWAERQRGFSDFAVLCRTRKQLPLIEACLAKEGIPCAVAAREEWTETAEVEAALRFFEGVLSNKEYSACAAPAVESNRFTALQKERSSEKEQGGRLLRSALDALAGRCRSAAETPLKLLKDFAASVNVSSPAYDKLLLSAALYDDMPSLLRDVLLGAEGDVKRAAACYGTDCVKLMTLHGAKGLEFPVVFICGVNQGVLPLAGTGDICEERRLFYVGMTRAQEELILLSGPRPSSFLREVSGLIKEQAEPPSVRQLSLFDG